MEGKKVEDAAWTYREPLTKEFAHLKDYIAFGEFERATESEHLMTDGI